MPPGGGVSEGAIATNSRSGEVGKGGKFVIWSATFCGNIAAPARSAAVDRKGGGGPGGGGGGAH